MQFKLLLFILVLLLFQGCTHKQSVKPNMQLSIDINQTQAQATMDEEDDTDTFDDEYEEEPTITKNDPLSGYNRMMTSFNNTLFIYLFNPISEGYAYILPEAIRISLSHFVHNIQFPIRFTNNLLQGKFQNTSDELGRFVINTTVGIGGLFDPATVYMQIPTHDEDFGQTLGYYGFEAGYHVVLPFLGPSNIRDIIGLIADGYASPLNYTNLLRKYKLPKNYLQSAGIYGLNMINKNALNLGAYESLKKDAIDLYPFLRDIYEQKRTADIAE